MSGTTARLALPYPGLGDTADVPRDVQALATALDVALVWASGTFAARPAASLSGKVYYATDQQKLYLDTGAAWVDVNNVVNTADIAANAVTDAKIANGAFVPIGALVDFAGTSAPTNWLLCDGSAVSRVTYATLFGLAGSTYGAGDGSTTFNVPDFRGRVGVGAGTGSGLSARSRGATGGEELHVLTVSELATHTHSPINLDGARPNLASTGGTWSMVSVTTGGSTHVASTSGVDVGGATSTSGTGSSSGHNNLQPFLVATKIIRAL